MADFEVCGTTYNDINILKPFMEQDKSVLLAEKFAGIPDNTERAIESLLFEKLLHNRDTEAQLHQIVITLSKDELVYDNDTEGNTLEESVPVAAVAEDISEVIDYLGFHHYMFVQDNDADWSMYYMINSVNFRSGRRSTNSNKLCRKISEFMEFNYR